MNKIKVRLILRENPVKIKWRGKTIPIKWFVEYPDSMNYYTFRAEGIPSTTSDGTFYTKYLNSVDILERGFKYIFPRIIGISLTKIFDINKKFLLVELAYIRTFNKIVKNSSTNPKTKDYHNRLYKVMERGFWKIYKNRLPERLDLRLTENKKWYKKRTGVEYQSDKLINKKYNKGE